MKITVKTSSPEFTEDIMLCPGLGNNREPGGVIVPELRWVHQKTRVDELVKAVRKGRDMVVVTWDELTMLVVLAAAAEGRASVTVLYRDANGEHEIPCDEHGTLASWPDPDGFFHEKDRVLFDSDLFG